MADERVDRPLSVERLSTAELAAAGAAAATIVAARYARPAAPGMPGMSISASWWSGAAGESWSIAIVDWSPVPVGEEGLPAAAALLQPILDAMRPRALTHHFRSMMDEISRADLEMIANSGTSPNAEAYVPRWVEDRTVLSAPPYKIVDREAVVRARDTLADIYARLALSPPLELERTVAAVLAGRGAGE